MEKVPVRKQRRCVRAEGNVQIIETMRGGVFVLVMGGALVGGSSAGRSG